MPRTILAAALCLLTLAAGCADHGPPAPTAPAPAPATDVPPGPWGELTARPIRLAPPPHTVATLLTPSQPRQWTLRDLTRIEMADLLSELDLPDDEYQALLDTLRPLPAEAGYTLTPAAATVRALAPQTRGLLYHRLARDPVNLPQMNAFRYWGASGHGWFDGSRLSPATRALVEPLIYQHGQFLFFADLDLILPHLPDESDQLELLTVLASETTWMIELHVPEGADVTPLVDYWAHPGTAKETSVLLNALAQRPGGGSIDIVHLLPPFARQRLYTYPDGNNASDGLEPGASRDCHWTALNFFHDQPDDRFATAAVVADVYRTQCDRITDQPALGDIVTFSHDGTIFHSAVYIAADILFTHNGTRASRPWMLLPLEAMKDFYPQPGPVTVQILRRRL